MKLMSWAVFKYRPRRKLYIYRYPKTTRVTAIRIFITPRKEQKVSKPLSSCIFIKNFCERAREGRGRGRGKGQSYEVN